MQYSGVDLVVVISMESDLNIPPPLTEENKDSYLEELSNFIEADDWIERHSIENQSNYGVNKSEHHHDAKTTFKEEPAKFYEVIIEVMIALIGVIILLFFVPLIGLALFG